jgi:hypothetical protein
VADDMSRAERAFAIGLTGLMLGAVLWPLGAHPRDGDDFPLSTYPMFAKPRKSPSSLIHLVTLHEDGSRRVLGLEWLDERQPMAAFRAIRRAARKHTRRARLCNDVAARLAGTDRAIGVVEVQMRNDYFPIREYFLGETEPVRSKVLFRCKIPEAP